MSARILSTLLALLLAVSSSQADGMKYGVKVGLNLATVKVEKAPSWLDYGTKIGFGLGGYGVKEYSVPWGMRIELLYLQRGFTVTMSSFPDYTGTISYLTLPIFWTYGFSGSDMKPYLEFGPEVGFKLTAKGESNGKSGDMDGVSLLDYGINLGVGLARGAVNADVRYYFGLANTNSEDDDKVNHRGFLFTLGYTFE